MDEQLVPFVEQHGIVRQAQLNVEAVFGPDGTDRNIQGLSERFQYQRRSDGSRKRLFEDWRMRRRPSLSGCITVVVVFSRPRRGAGRTPRTLL